MFDHPILGRRLPTLGGLLERCDSPETRALLVEAGRVARERIERDVGARETLVALDATFVDPPRRVEATPAVVTQGDLLVAMFAVEHERFQERVFGGAELDPATRNFMADARSRRGRGREGNDLALEYAWGAHHVLREMRGDEEPVGVETLADALGRRVVLRLAAWLDVFAQGLVTVEEAAARLPDRRTESVGRIHADRFGGIDALDRALEREPFVWVTGDVDTERSHLARAWMRRVAYRTAPAAFRGLAPGVAWFALGTEPEPTAFGLAHGVSLDATIFTAVRPNLPTKRGSAQVRVGDVTLTGGAGGLWRTTPDDLRVVLELLGRRMDAGRVIVTATAAERRIVCESVPEAVRYPVLEVPAVVATDLLSRWVATVADARIEGGRVPSVREMVNAFGAASTEERQRCDVGDVDRALARPRGGDDDAARFVKTLDRARRNVTLTRRDEERVERFVGSRERLDALAAFEQSWAPFSV